MFEVENLPLECWLCGKPTNPVGKTFSKFCSDSCRSRWYRRKYQIEKIDSLIRQNKIEEISATIKELNIIGYDVVISKRQSI